MFDYDDELPFPRTNYKEENKKKINEISKLLYSLLDKQENQINLQSTLTSIEWFLNERLAPRDIKTDFSKMEELVYYVRNELQTQVYGEWHKLPDSCAKDIALQIKKCFQNGFVDHVNIIIDDEGMYRLDIEGFGNYDITF